jgi:hypothetical protein
MPGDLEGGKKEEDEETMDYLQDPTEIQEGNFIFPTQQELHGAWKEKNQGIRGDS